MAWQPQCQAPPVLGVGRQAAGLALIVDHNKQLYVLCCHLLLHASLIWQIQIQLGQGSIAGHVIAVAMTMLLLTPSCMPWLAHGK
jgi:hypothetical protein